jgi:hypothetical protein
VADIKVERRGPSIWPWIVGLLVLALLIWLLVEMFGRTGEPVIQAPVVDTLQIDTPATGFGAPTVPPPGPAAPDTPAVGVSPGAQDTLPAEAVPPGTL